MTSLSLNEIHELRRSLEFDRDHVGQVGSDIRRRAAWLLELMETCGNDTSLQQRIARCEALIVLSVLLDLHDPPTEACQRRHAEDKIGWNLALSCAVHIGRQVVPRPLPCRMCYGKGEDRDGIECNECDAWAAIMPPQTRS